MGATEPLGHRGRQTPPRPEATAADLERWEEHGAVWRALEASDERVVIELCTCFGEPVDVLTGEDPELIAFVKRRRGVP